MPRPPIVRVTLPEARQRLREELPLKVRQALWRLYQSSIRDTHISIDLIEKVRRRVGLDDGPFWDGIALLRTAGYMEVAVDKKTDRYVRRWLIELTPEAFGLPNE